MKKITLLLPICLLLFSSSCKKDPTGDNALSVRCSDFESLDCLQINWAGLNDKVQISNQSYNGSKCLLIATDSTKPGNNVFTYVDGFDSNQVYRISLYAKYKKTSPHLPYQSHNSIVSIYPWGTNLTIVSINNNSNDPIEQEWKKYMTIYQSSSDIPARLSISVSDIDSVWIDDIVITKF